MAEEAERAVRVPPRWFVRSAWKVHRVLYRLTGKGLWTPANRRGWGALRLTTTGLRSGRERAVILGYLEDGPDLVLLAMNGWGEGEPAWLLNLRAHPEACVEVAGVEGSGAHRRRVVAHAAGGAERDRLWAMWRAVEPQLDHYAALRSTPTDVVVLRPA